MNTEEMLKAVVEAQCDGGFDEFQYSDLHIEMSERSCIGCMGNPFDSGYNDHVLQVLLNPSGLKAAYGEKKVCNGCGNSDSKITCCPDHTLKYSIGMKANRWAAISILDAWLSSPEGNVKAAIECAYSLLKKS